MICSDCKRPLKLSPPLSERIGHDGRPMTTAEARSLFFQGGRCPECFIAWRSAQSVALMRRHCANAADLAARQTVVHRFTIPLV